MKVAQVKAYQRKRFEDLLAYTMTHSKFYARYYHKQGIREEHIRSLDVTDLPTINKQILMENFDEVVCDQGLKLDAITRFIGQPENVMRKFLGKYTVICSSGTTGHVGVSVYGPDEWQYPVSLTSARMDSPFKDLLHRIKMISIVAGDGNYAGISMLSSAPRIRYDHLPISIGASLNEMVERINAFPGAQVITGYAGGVYQLARLQLEGRISQHPRLITTSAETLTPGMRSVIREAFGVNPRNFYAASESLSMAGECEFHSGMHLFSDWHIFETLDDQDHSVPPGSSGRLVLTNLYRKVQPIIRYELNDLVSIDYSPCKCGSPFPRIEAFHGRESIYLEFEKDGHRAFLHQSKLGAFDVPGVQVSQFVQEDPASLRINSTTTTPDREAVSGAILAKAASLLRSNGLGFVNVSVRLVDNIPIDPKTKKIPWIIPLQK